MSKYRKMMNLVVLFSFSLLSVFWMLSAQNSFCFDDTSWMMTVNASTYEELFSFFPHSAYLDRPVGIIFLKFLHSAFGLDYGRHHAVLVIVHLINVLLTFIVVKQIFQRKYENEDRSFLAGIISAAFFGIWARTHMAVQWDAAIFDLLGTFWSLLSMLFYLRYRNSSKNRGQNLFLLMLFFYLAIRTKEMFLVLPILFAIYEIWEMFLDKKAKKFTLATGISFVTFIVFFGMILYCKSQGSITNDVDNPYYQSFNPMKLVANLLRYCMLCFDMENTGWSYAFSISGLLGTVLIVLGLAVAVWLAIKHKKIDLLLCYMAIAVSIVIVLPMVNQIHALYLYFPTIFVGILLASVVNGLKMPNVVSLLLMCLFLATGASKGAVSTINYWYANAEMEKTAWEDIANIPAPVPDSTIYVRNVEGVAYTPFFYGEGAVCKLLYNDMTLKVEELGADEEVIYSEPYVVWNYQNGRVSEIERNGNRELYINNVYQYPQEDGSLILGIVPDKMSGTMNVYIDGVEQLAVMGGDFISVQIVHELLEGKESIVLNIEDQYETMSDDYIIQLDKN